MGAIDQGLAELAAGRFGVFSRQQAREAGLTPSALSRRIASGELVACGTSALRLAGPDLSYRGQLAAGLFNLGPQAVISGRSAAHLLGLDHFDAGPLDYLAPRSVRGRSTDGTVRLTATIGPLDVVLVDDLRCTSATRTVVELLATATLEEAGSALASATRMRLTAPNVVARRLLELGRAGRAGVAAFDELVRDGRVESWLERRFVRLVSAAGLPMPRLQQRYELTGFGTVRVDFEFDVPSSLPFSAPSIVVEVGGRLGYLSHAERQRQEARRNALQLQGKTVYFFTRDDVVERPSSVIDTLSAALARSAANLAPVAPLAAIAPLGGAGRPGSAEDVAQDCA